MSESSKLIHGTYLWDGLRAEVIPDGAILIEDSKIKAVGTAASLSSLPHSDKVEWPGTTIMPGLIDSHNHLSMDATLSNYLDHMSDNVAELTIRAKEMSSKDLRAGVTTMRCLGDKEFLDIDCRDAIGKGLVEGPRVLVATRGIRAPEGHGFVGYPFNGPDEIRKAIVENLQAGADFIKIYITGTLKGTGALSSFLTKEEIRTAVEEAHRSGVRIAAHCVGGQGLDWALDVGLDTIEHGYHISAEQIERLADSDSWLVLTPSPFMTESRIRHLPEGLIQGHLDERQEVASRMAAAIASDLVYGVGTDGMHAGLAQEVIYLAELGASNLAALKAATINGAIICATEKETGSLEVGKNADLIAVTGNPLEDLNVLNKPVGVMKQGRLIVDPLTSFDHSNHG